MTHNNQNIITYYGSLRNKMEFTRRIAKRCQISSNAVLKWCQGDCKTSNPERLRILAEETGIAQEDLFNRELDNE